MNDFTTMDVEGIDGFLAAHSWEFDMDYATGRLPGAVASGLAWIECRPLAFALLLRMQRPAGVAPHLWALYVAPEARGRRIGADLVRELVRVYAGECPMTLSCYGARRRRYFGRLGFRVEGRDAEWRRMTSARTRIPTRSEA
jgi:GNAT superfamily N-acetyltransferase